MHTDELDALSAEFSSPYTIDVRLADASGETVVRQRTVAGLLVQLLRAAEPGGADPSGGGGGSGYGPRPPVRLAAVNLLDEMRRRLSVWAQFYAGRPGTGPADSLFELSAVAYAIDRQTVSALVDELTGWRTRARWILGWESPPMAPHVPCPACAGIGTLRLWADIRYVACLLCGTWWDNDHLGHLRDYLRLSRDLAHSR